MRLACRVVDHHGEVHLCCKARVQLDQELVDSLRGAGVLLPPLLLHPPSPSELAEDEAVENNYMS